MDNSSATGSDSILPTYRPPSEGTPESQTSIRAARSTLAVRGPHDVTRSPETDMPTAAHSGS